MYRTDTESRDRAARLDFDRQTQLVVNDLNNKKLELERLRTSADTAYTRMRTQQVAQDMANSIESLQQSAERLEMDKTNSVFRNIESVTKSLDNFSHSYVNSMTAVDRLLEVVEKGLKLGG
jgi:Zn-dependent oligopeptidase